jgi:hypothetical protein
LQANLLNNTGMIVLFPHRASSSDQVPVFNTKACSRHDEGWALDGVTKIRKGPEESGLPLIASVARTAPTFRAES